MLSTLPMQMWFGPIILRNFLISNLVSFPPSCGGPGGTRIKHYPGLVHARSEPAQARFEAPRWSWQYSRLLPCGSRPNPTIACGHSFYPENTFQ